MLFAVGLVLRPEEMHVACQNVTGDARREPKTVGGLWLGRKEKSRRPSGLRWPQIKLPVYGQHCPYTTQFCPPGNSRRNVAAETMLC
jgi:hypothetical protein